MLLLTLAVPFSRSPSDDNEDKIRLYRNCCRAAMYPTAPVAQLFDQCGVGIDAVIRTQDLLKGIEMI